MKLHHQPQELRLYIHMQVRYASTRVPARCFTDIQNSLPVTRDSEKGREVSKALYVISETSLGLQLSALLCSAVLGREREGKRKALGCFVDSSQSRLGNLGLSCAVTQRDSKHHVRCEQSLGLSCLF